MLVKIQSVHTGERNRKKCGKGLHFPALFRHNTGRENSLVRKEKP